ncbi:aspartic protease [Lithospermum erythrorhizon]|uniref:Aspartic protease n=1 Tax=Lithospermum erythrorhizon TaxID=34254 RepID=A0AAV3PE54_LITER
MRYPLQFDRMMKELHSLKLIRGQNNNDRDICFSGAGSEMSDLSKSFPAVDMVFSNGQKLTLSPENYLFRHSKEHGTYCLGIFQNGKDSTTLLGGIVVRNTLVTYDREHKKIGFWKTNCSELWQRLQLPGIAPPMHGGSVKPNSTADISPSLAPSGPTKININGIVIFSYNIIIPKLMAILLFGRGDTNDRSHSLNS